MPIANEEIEVAFVLEIAPGATVRIVPAASPPVGFEGSQLVVVDPASFAVVDIETGGRSQFVTVGEVPAFVFAPTDNHPTLKMDPTTAEDPAPALTVRNGGPDAAIFSAVIRGHVPGERTD